MLAAIQSWERTTRGYHMSISFPKDINEPHSWELHEVYVPILCYMDDIVFIDSSQQRIQSTMDLAQEFYDIHDVHINGKKCEALVFNSQIPRNIRSLTIGRDKSIITPSDREVRYLGVWFSSSPQS